MKKIEEKVMLRQLVAEDGKIIISRNLNEFGNPVVVSKHIYLGKEDLEDNYLEINEEDLILNKEGEE